MWNRKAKSQSRRGPTEDSWGLGEALRGQEPGHGVKWLNIVEACERQSVEKLIVQQCEIIVKSWMLGW